MYKFPRCHAIISPRCSKLREPNSVIGKALRTAEQRHGQNPSWMTSHCPEVHNSKTSIQPRRASQEPLVVKNPPTNAGDAGDMGSNHGWGRSTGGRNGNLFQYSCLENSMDRGAWQATVHGTAKSWTQLSTQYDYILQKKINVKISSGRSYLFWDFILYLTEWKQFSLTDLSGLIIINILISVFFNFVKN